MKRRKIEFPVAKYREDGTPAIWLTHSIWLMLRQHLANTYCQGQEREADAKARSESQADIGSPDQDINIWGDIFTEQKAKEALNIFRIGYETHQDVERRNNGTTPEELVETGAKIFKRYYAEACEKYAGAFVRKELWSVFPFERRFGFDGGLASWSGVKEAA